MKGARLSLLVLMTAGLFACAPRAGLVRSSPTAEARQHVHWLDVPFFPNDSDQCGPSALASVLHYWGANASPEQLRDEIYLAKPGGTLPMDMSSPFKSRGLYAAVSDGSFAEIKAQIRARHPVIAYLDFGTRRFPIGHYVVITGYDDAKSGFYLHSGMREDKFATYRRFDRGWKDTNRWMLIVSTAPVVAAFDEERAYEFALRRDRHSQTALMALGNFSYERGDYEKAAAYYRRVLKLNPNHGGANNNLAMVYLQQAKNLTRAESYARRALGTPYAPYAEDTLKEIETRRAQK